MDVGLLLLIEKRELVLLIHFGHYLFAELDVLISFFEDDEGHNE